MIRSRLSRLERKVASMATQLEELLTLIDQLKKDGEEVVKNAEAEFAKLEAEIAVGGAVNLTPAKEAVQELDTKLKAVVIPTA